MIAKPIVWSLLLLVFLRTDAKVCYILTERPPRHRAGFFSTFNTVIGALEFIDKNNLELIIQFDQDGHYYDPTQGDNWWSYYFEPIPLQGPANNIHTYKQFTVAQMNAFSHQGQFLLPPTRAHELLNKYVRIKPAIAQKIDSFVRDNFQNHYVIGIHYRGTDKTTEAPAVTYASVLQSATLIMQQANTTLPIKFFIATDADAFLKYMQRKLPKAVCSIDAIRSHNNAAVHLNEKNANYKKGEDALIDCILLSKTNFLIKTASNLSDVSLQFNPDLPVIHLSRTINDPRITSRYMQDLSALHLYTPMASFLTPTERKNSPIT